MYNKYTIEVFQDNKDVKAKIYLGKDCLGTVWRPNGILDKNQYKDLFESVGNIIYGQETKAEKESKSYSSLLTLLQAQNSAGQEEAGC